MKILFAVSYYRPHVSGLTVYAERLAEALAARGHQVTVITSQHRQELPREETLSGARVVRVPVMARLSKGALMPSYAARARALLRGQEIVVTHLPATPVEAIALASLARVMKLPHVAVYHCDVRLPASPLNAVLNEAMHHANALVGRLASRIVTLTDDYARASRLLRLFTHKLEVISPAVLIDAPTQEAVEALRRRHAPRGEHLIGVAARFAAEKGLEYLLEALPRVRRSVGEVRVLLTGEPQSVIGEERYFAQLQPLLRREADSLVFLGMLGRDELSAFYAASDVTVLPSTNSTEAFGLVQLESMLCGTPVVASELPGVRVPVRATGMGRLAPPRDAERLAEAIAEVIGNRERYTRARAAVAELFSFARMIDEYEELFERLKTSDG